FGTCLTWSTGTGVQPTGWPTRLTLPEPGGTVWSWMRIPDTDYVGSATVDVLSSSSRGEKASVERSTRVPAVSTTNQRVQRRRPQPRVRAPNTYGATHQAAPSKRGARPRPESSKGVRSDKRPGAAVSNCGLARGADRSIQ